MVIASGRYVVETLIDALHTDGRSQLLQRFVSRTEVVPDVHMYVSSARVISDDKHVQRIFGKGGCNKIIKYISIKNYNF